MIANGALVILEYDFARLQLLCARVDLFVTDELIGAGKMRPAEKVGELFY